MYNKINGFLNVSGLQLEYVKEGGCDKSLYTVSNIVNYFLKKSSDVFIVTLDASSAFNKVNIYSLMTKLIKRNVPFNVIRTLLSRYSNSKACVKLSGNYLEYIIINSGVKQGGILSPLFYNIYVDEFDYFDKADLGCSIGGIYYGTVFYADDIVLVGASKMKVQQMLNICYTYCYKYGMYLNSAKSKWMCTDVHNKCKGVQFDLKGKKLENVVNGIRYLGVNLVMDRKELTTDIDDRIKKFKADAYDVLFNSSDLSETIRCELVVKKCLSILIYGIGAINVDQIAIYRFHVAYRKIFRYIFNLPLRAHISDLLELFDIESVENIMCLKCQRISSSYITSRFKEIACLALLSMYNL